MSATGGAAGGSSSEAGRAHVGDDSDMESLNNNNNNGEMQKDRAWPARHDGPVLPPSGSVSLNLIARGPF